MDKKGYNGGRVSYDGGHGFEIDTKVQGILPTQLQVLKLQRNLQMFRTM